MIPTIVHRSSANARCWRRCLGTVRQTWPSSGWWGLSQAQVTLACLAIAIKSDDRDSMCMEKVYYELQWTKRTNGEIHARILVSSWNRLEHAETCWCGTMGEFRNVYEKIPVDRSVNIYSHSGSYFGSTMSDGFQVQGTSTIDLDILQWYSQRILKNSQLPNPFILNKLITNSKQTEYTLRWCDRCITRSHSNSLGPEFLAIAITFCKPWLQPNSKCLSDGSSVLEHQRQLHRKDLHDRISTSGLHAWEFCMLINNRSTCIPNPPFPTAIEAIILLILLVWWLELPASDPSEGPYQVVEYFSGVGRIARLAAYFGFEVAALDIEYGADYSNRTGKRSPMDINSNAGLLNHGCGL